VSDNKPSDQRNGCFLDKMWCCKVCDGEIPDGHTSNCDIWKLEKNRDEWRKQCGIGVQSQFDEGKKYEARIAELQAALRWALQRMNTRDYAEHAQFQAQLQEYRTLANYRAEHGD